MRSLKIAVDFDGTVVDHRYPQVGPDAPGAVEVLLELVNAGHKIILYTMRSGKELKDAIEWFEERGIPLYSVGKDKGQSTWTTSNKCHADICIDDRNFGCPMVFPRDFLRRCVSWPDICAELIPREAP